MQPVCSLLPRPDLGNFFGHINSFLFEYLLRHIFISICTNKTFLKKSVFSNGHPKSIAEIECFGKVIKIYSAVN